jgi:hypothetical protein
LKQLNSQGIKAKKKSISIIEIEHKGTTVLYYPRKEWFTGSRVVDGRGFDNLLSQLRSPKIPKQPTFGDVVGEYWIVDRGLFMSLGKVNTPIMQSSNHAELKFKLAQIPNGVLTLTKYIVNPDGTYKVYFQQIKRTV